MDRELEVLIEEGTAAITAAESMQDLQQTKSAFLSKKGRIGEQMARIRDLPSNMRKAFGENINTVKIKLEEEFENRKAVLHEKKLQEKIAAQRLDVSLPGLRFPAGRYHPLTRIWNEAAEIFIAMGFDVVEGPEVETEWYNFEALNLHADHPARDEQDSFYISDSTLLRTQTSPVQIRTMERIGKTPIQMVAPGRTFRRDTVDASHSPVFNQIEGLMIDKNITMSHLKAVLEAFNKEMFGKDVKSRFRPDYFPFTEPSVEIAISCIMCGGKGCNVCKRSGWIEILGAGMVHPQVLRNGGLDPDEVSGFAFGIGIDRVAMLKYQIDDIRLLYENDLRFLEQF
ncbi:MAG TPA: phenylalanine--tRNA ligase subunit alpha [bacterium]|nr:phenylalanine--tRNA ligase subunit alpha [bacterium]